jgi:hypothetical protein
MESVTSGVDAIASMVMKATIVETVYVLKDFNLQTFRTQLILHTCRPFVVVGACVSEARAYVNAHLVTMGKPATKVTVRIIVTTTGSVIV